MKKSLLVFIVVFMVALAGCGGGGGGGGEPAGSGDGLVRENATSVPTANAGPDQNVTTGSIVALSGSGTDPEGALLTYAWAFSFRPEGSMATLSDPTVANPSFIADVDGKYVLGMSVDDGDFTSQSDFITIAAATLNSAPTANAGPDQNVSTGSVVALDGKGLDADGDLLTYEWGFALVPAGSTATLSDATDPNPSFVVDLDGTYVLSFSVYDGTLGSFVDFVTVTASALNSVPTANAGPDQNVTAGSIVTLSGDGLDADGDLLTYSWVFVSMPDGSTATLSDRNSANPTFEADLEGAYVLNLSVDDGNVVSFADFVTVTASYLNSAPTANAGPDQNVTAGSIVTLSGDGLDADGDLLTYSWAFVSMPDGSTATLSDRNSANPTFKADLEGAYVLNLSVDDGTVDSLTDSIIITTHLPELQIGIPYEAADGLTVTIDDIVVTEKLGSFVYAVYYSLQNDTLDQQIDEASLKLYFNDNTGLPQYGLFGTLFPGDSLSRVYNFEALKSKTPTVVGYHQDHFFSNSPPTGSLIWKVELR